MNKKDLKERIADLKISIQEKQEEIENFSIDPDDFTEEYNNSLDEIYGDFMSMYPASRVLEEVDPTAYNCGLNDFTDTIDVAETEQYKELEEELEELEAKEEN